MAIDLIDQAHALGQQMNGSDPATINPLGSLGHFVVNVTGAEHGLGLLGPVLGGQTPLDSSLAIAESFAVSSAHSK